MYNIFISYILCGGGEWTFIYVVVVVVVENYSATHCIEKLRKNVKKKKSINSYESQNAAVIYVVNLYN